MKQSQPLFIADISGAAAPEAGIYTWDIEKNLVFADAALASLFGLDPAESAHGLPIEAYLDRVHPEDRPPLAKVIHNTIVAETPQQSTYRVRDKNGVYHWVAAFGRAFRDRADNPTLYSGIVVPATQVERNGQNKQSANDT
ncbi:PAS domain-containing protein [Rhizobium sp. BR 314]|uniref:PAS domain-containing protein n=1 Tax=Rhizobium sp. BR 314 TaxID=3040013 RepID=UPI0039BFBBEA